MEDINNKSIEYFRKGYTLSERYYIKDEEYTHNLYIHNFPVKITFDKNNKITLIDKLNDDVIKYNNLDTENIITFSYGGHKHMCSQKELLQSTKHKYFDTSIVGWYCEPESEECYVRIGDNFLLVQCFINLKVICINITYHKYLQEKYAFNTILDYELPDNLKDGKLYLCENDVFSFRFNPV